MANGMDEATQQGEKIGKTDGGQASLVKRLLPVAMIFCCIGAVFAFGLAHGLGLATKVTELTVSSDGLVTNILSFNVGVEIGQVLALLVVVAVLNEWRKREAFMSHAKISNTVLMAGGFLLAGYQFSGMVLA